jgi:regulator of replication initiation timing
MKVKVSDHARYDSFPLRFGFVAPDFLELVAEVEDSYATARQKPKEIRAGNKHYIGELWSCQGEKLCRARVVLSGENDADLHPTIITVLSEVNIPVDRAVSEIVRAKRESGSLSIEKIIEVLHPLYIQERISSPENLIDIFVDMGVSKANQKITELEAVLKSIEKNSDSLLEEHERIKKENESLKEKILQQEKSKINYKGEAIKVSPVSRLISVREGKRKNSRGEEVNCTYLKFEDPDLPERKMDEVFDKSGKITAKARAMADEKKYVRTSTWKPEIFKELEWFRDIYEAPIQSEYRSN